MSQPIELKINLIRTDGGTQPRAQLNYITVNEYAESIEDGATFPPVDVVYDGNDYWLWDGFHRLDAHKKAGRTAIHASVKQGTRRDAVLLSVGANNSHGLRRTNDDKRRSVITLLNDTEWAKWSDREIARRCSVSHELVRQMRPNDIHTVNIDSMNNGRTFVHHKTGQPTAMNTANIGKMATQPVGPVVLKPRLAAEVGRNEPRFVPALPSLRDEMTEVVASGKQYDVVEIDTTDDYDNAIWTEDEQPEIELQPKPQAKPQGSFKNVITVAEWQQMTGAEKNTAIEEAPKGTKYGWNETNDNIEWAAWSWNPLTGCLHNCAYCYARDIAQRFYTHLPDGERFSPVFYPDRLYAPANAAVPTAEIERLQKTGKDIDKVTAMAKRNVFVCSMADLFGKWVPTEWINAVLQQAWDNPQWTFLFLTKFPIRMAEFEYPPNTWIGTTVDAQWAVDRAEKAFRKVRAGGYQGVAWLSCEPMMERLTFTEIDLFDWVVVGGSSESSQTAEFKPPFEWIVHLWNQAQAHNLPIYMKTNLFDRVKEYPGT